MSDVIAVYCRNKTIGSVLIRNASWGGQWSHVGLVTPEQTVLESRYPEGVVETPLDVFLARTTEHQFIHVKCPNPQAAYDFYRSQVGKAKYDIWAILGIIFRNAWAKSNAWHCTEIFETALEAGGALRFRTKEKWRITPQVSFMVP